jgi:hypothetical protein
MSNNGGEARLRAYRIDDVDVFVARGREDLPDAIREHYGDTYEEMTGDSLAEAHIAELDPATELPISWECEDMVRRPVTKTVGAWIIDQGRGMLCSTEY